MEEGADVCEMVHMKNYICCFKYICCYCFIVGSAATYCRILVKTRLTENCGRVEGGGVKVEMSFHYSVSRFFIGEIRTEDLCVVVYTVLKQRNEDEEDVKSWE